jgi:flagellar motor switch protein FliG
LENIQPDALKELERVMEKKFNSNASLRATQAGGIRSAANVMNYLKSNVEGAIMKDLTKRNKDIAKEIQENMFDFENLLGIDDKSMQSLIRSLDNELIVVALKGADDSLTDKFFASMSLRAAANIKDEMEALGPMRLTDVQEAQKQVIAVARQLPDSTIDPSSANCLATAITCLCAS